MSVRIDPREQDQRLFERLHAAARSLGSGVRAWIVGGYPRDRLLGREPGLELDLAISGTDGLEFARALGADAHPRGHGGPAAHLRNGQALLDGVHVDFTRLRRESYGEASRIPVLDGAEASLEEDAARRDFTINALYAELRSGVVVDPTGRGLEDLAARRLCTPIDLEQSLRQDPLRYFRGVRFAAQLGFELPEEWRALESHADLAPLFELKLSGARVREELLGKPDAKRGALTGSGAARALELLLGCAPAARWLGRVHERAIERLRELESELALPAEFGARAARVLLAVLGIDAELALARLQVPREIAQRVSRSRALEASWERGRGPSDRELRAALHRGGPEVLDALHFALAEVAGLSARVERARAAVARGEPLLARDLLALGFAPGPQLGRALERLREAWLDDPTLDAERARALLSADPQGPQS
ncbi:MAG: CCA tRNA nucleotidyltransferase [Planctomycetes bacterium]|nr:CCA tRNA nucleotidyltransferase [Planctomycetota bacterium]